MFRKTKTKTSIGGGEIWIVETSSSGSLISGSHSFSTWKHERIKRWRGREEERAKSKERRNQIVLKQIQ